VFHIEFIDYYAENDFKKTRMSGGDLRNVFERILKSGRVFIESTATYNSKTCNGVEHEVFKIGTLMR